MSLYDDVMESSKNYNIFHELRMQIGKIYEEGISMDDAEKLAAKFLYSQMIIVDMLKNTELDARMKKSGVKAIKAAVYLDEAKKGDKKPSDTYLNALVDVSELVQTEQKSLDISEVKRDELQNYFNIFKEAHIYLRGIAKGRFE